MICFLVQFGGIRSPQLVKRIIFPLTTKNMYEREYSTHYISSNEVKLRFLLSDGNEVCVHVHTYASHKIQGLLLSPQRVNLLVVGRFCVWPLGDVICNTCRSHGNTPTRHNTHTLTNNTTEYRLDTHPR